MKTNRRLALFLVLAACGEGRLPGQPGPEPEVPDPRTVMSFEALYNLNCAGCHGAGGKGGLALGLANPAYLAVAPDAAIRQVITSGTKGTTMPAFGQSAGGYLSDAQLDVLVAGIRAYGPAVHPDPETPPYRAQGGGDAQKGETTFRDRCGKCHGPGGGKASSLVDPAYLALVSPQGLRTAVIAGRPDLGSPDWRAAGLSSGDVDDIVAWLIAQRNDRPGQPYPTKEAEEGRR